MGHNQNMRNIALAALALFGCSSAVGNPVQNQKKYPVQKTEAEWKKQLGPEAFRILRQGGTERAFTGKYWNHKESGVFRCAGCNQPLFDSKTKFKSGTGWPSYYEPINQKAVQTRDDTSFGMVRTEILCSRCGGHLGHVFRDGPPPTGLRYCVNSASLRFTPSH